MWNGNIIKEFNGINEKAFNAEELVKVLQKVNKYEKKIVAGNWKMNLNKEEAYLLFNNLQSKSFPKRCSSNYCTTINLFRLI